MSNIWVWLAAGVVVLYWAIVAVFGFGDIVGTVVNFGRAAIGVAVLVLYIPAITVVFKEVPAPSRDYLLAGIILTWLSASCFAMWNEAGRIFGVTTSIFVSPVAGFFSLLLVMGGGFHLVALAMTNKKRAIAVGVGLAAGAALVFIAPLFR